MSRYRLHRIKDAPWESFRWTAHTAGLTIVKPKDYDFDYELDAATPYAAWKFLASQGSPLRPGDILELLRPEAAGEELYIAKYTGFDVAHWFVPEPRAEKVAIDSAFAPPASIPEPSI